MRGLARTLILMCLFGLLSAEAWPGAVGVFAQSASIGGTITDASDGNPLPGAHVRLIDDEGIARGVVTDEFGIFVLDALDPGRYYLDVSYIGFTTYRDTLVLAEGQSMRRQIALEEWGADLEEVVIETDRGKTVGNNEPALTTIRPSDLVRIPMPDISTDLAGYMLTMPGVITAGDRGGQLFVRGGTPTQNLVLLDGMELYQPFHLIGFFSAFPGDIISRADVYAGGFGARFGGRLSSVIDVTARNGNKQSYAGAASIAPFLSTLRLEGPISRGKVSFLGSIRQSVVEQVGSRFAGQPLPYRFGDQFLKVHAYLNNTTSASGTFVRTFDEGDLAGTGNEDLRIAWRNTAYGGRYMYLPEESPILTELSFSISRLESEFGPSRAPRREANVDGFNGQIKFAYLLGRNDLQFGAFVRSVRLDFTLEGAGELIETNTEGGLYIEGRVEATPTLEVRPGLRLHSYPSKSRTSIEPRFRLAWSPFGASANHRLTAAWGIFRQEIVGLNDERDVGGVFTAWSSTPRNQNLPAAMHTILGWQSRVLPWVDLDIEGYYKSLSNLTVFTGTTGLERADGTAAGVDVKVELTRPFFYGYVGYGLAFVEYQIKSGELGQTGFTYNPPHDRRHRINLVGRLVRGAYSFGVRWEYGSGFPFTKVEGFFNRLDLLFSDNRHLTQSGDAQVIYDEPFQGQLPAYHRLDITLERAFQSKNVKGAIQAGILNVYNRQNVFYYDLFAARRVDQLPFMPTIGLRIEFD
ncbi:MAG: carboxypeptidase regulatory-like domain-containing protein [Rhodothermia bacterium]